MATIYPTLLYLVFVVCIPTGVLAQAVNLLDSLDLPGAVIIANRDPVARQSVGHSFQVITAAELATLPVSSAAEALQYVNGLDVRQRGPRGVQADLSIRGGTFDQALVLINGIRLADPQTGHHLLNIPVPLENIERIEVMKGPGARVYGQNAFAGAVNIITKVNSKQSADLRAEVGENGLGGFGVSLNLPLAKVKQTLSYQRDFASGYRPNTDYVISNSFYQAELLHKGNAFGLIAGLSDRAFGANGFYSTASATQQYEEIQTSLLGITHNVVQDNGKFSQRISWRRNQDEYIFVRENPSIFRNLHVSQVYGYDAYKSINNRFGTLGLAGEVQGVSLKSNNLGDRERFVANALVEQAFVLDDGRLRVTPGLSFNYLSDAGSQLLPGLDVNYDLTDKTSLYGNAGLTYRVPTYTDLYYSDRFNLGNENLEAERAYAFEAGVRYATGGFEAQGSMWHREAIDLIDYVRDNQADTVWQPRNVTEASFTGLEVELSARKLCSWLPLARISYAYIDAQLPAGDEFISRYALENLRHQATALAVVKLARPLSATITVRHADRLSEPIADAPSLDYTLLDVRADYRLEGVRFFAEATNLTDEVYSQSNGVPLPGRWMRMGVALHLE